VKRGERMLYERYPDLKYTLDIINEKNNYDECINILMIESVTAESVFDVYTKYFLYFSFIDVKFKFISIDVLDLGSDFSAFDYIVIWDRPIDAIFSIASSIQEKKTNICQRIQRILQISTAEQFSSQTVIIMGFEPMVYSGVGNSDMFDPQGLEAEYTKCISRFLLEMKNKKNIKYLSVDSIFTRFGYRDVLNSIYSNIWGLPFSSLGCCEFANLLSSFIIGHRNKAKKCIVLDCDDVLWGGSIGELEIDTIVLNDSTKAGKQYQSFQQSLFELQSRGTVLAIVSKNYEENVKRVFNEHPHMIIKDKNIAAYSVNWDDKVTNIRKIASKLNISLSSMVFIDDSDFEVQLVNEYIKELTIIKFPLSKPENAEHIVRTASIFTSFEITQEDRNRTLVYKSKINEEALLLNSESYSDFLKLLEMNIEMKKATVFDTDRIHQMINRTNQFNINLIRYSRECIEEFISKDNIEVIVVKYKDKFCDYGIVGIIAMEIKAQVLILPIFLLSCKALKRNIEYKMFEYCINIAKNNDVKSVKAIVNTKAKNYMAIEFLSDLGFKALNENEMFFRLTI
jgi:FkbH-like protein